MLTGHRERQTAPADMSGLGPFAVYAVGPGNAPAAPGDLDGPPEGGPYSRSAKRYGSFVDIPSTWKSRCRTTRGSPDGPITLTMRLYLPAGTSFQSTKWLIGADAPSS